MNLKTPSFFKGKVLVFGMSLCSLGMLRGQTADSSSITALVHASEQNQKAIQSSLTLLLNQGASDQQVAAWRLANAPKLRLQLQYSQLLGAYEKFQPIDYVEDVVIPEGASQVLEDFLTARATLFNNWAQIHNQLIQAHPQISAAAANDLEERQNDLFIQQNAAALQMQTRRIRALAEQQAHQPEEVPGPSVIPVNASPALRAYLTLRDQLAREEAQVHNQYCTGDLKQMEAALERWRETNAARFQQLRQLALAQTNITQTSQ